jgi:hypothetical protein
MTFPDHFTDQLSRTITLKRWPQRIVSLVPSQTELLYSLGLHESVVGITKFCIHPSEWQRKKSIIGGTKKLDLDKIRSLQPDLIIANKEENEESQIKALMEEFSVWVSDINTLADALEMIREVGELTNTTNNAEQIALEIEDDFKQLEYRDSEKSAISAAYLIWKSPWMAAGNQTFIHDLMRRTGFINCFGHKDRYPEITIDELRELSPEVVLLSSEPYPFQQKHLDELGNYLPTTKILLVDGELFSWYGSRLKKSASYFRKLVEEIRTETHR